MANLNVMGVIRAGGDPELKFSPSGTPYAYFRGVASKSKKEGDEWVDVNTTWYQFTAFGPLAEFVAEHVSKGSQCNVFGETYSEEWTTDDGEKRTTLKVVLRGLDVIPRRDNNGGGNQHRGTPQNQRQEQGGGDPWGRDNATSEPPF